MESKLQSQIIKWLKSKGAYVIKTKPGMGTPIGCPDIVFIYEGAWGTIECKAAKGSRFQVGQKATYDRLHAWSPFVYIVYPTIWQAVKIELQTNFF
jgi:Holliday junction resolvase